MAYDEAVAAVIRERLAVARTIDESAELSFLESAGFRLELIGIVKQFDGAVTSTDQTLAALGDLRQRVLAVIAAAR
ncbi:hypothetical protein GCM10025867_16410 [Frondihabitans sucicola]|uniref:Acyl carrier protein n=1 Tax=Frondihabitans sucicola TaxID=1268041 RepID=A0ABM8GLW2_9MICO|nr:hypothetical protein [Frondihabitans sucicola]BDZ49400.1 hypothetical protein GCM10025867_16410 [Frondihabitans sucicola]